MKIGMFGVMKLRAVSLFKMAHNVKYMTSWGLKCATLSSHDSKLTAQILQTGTRPQFAIYIVIGRLFLKL